MTDLERRIAALADGSRQPVLVAIDGGAGAGKSTLAAKLAQKLEAAVVHMDDFFLPPGLRTPARLAEPGGNVHRERVAAEILEPLAAGHAATFRPFDCAAMDYAPAVTVPPRAVVVVEGAYSHHPDLRGHYGLTVFLDVSPHVQRARILARNGAMAEQFFQRWIPMENRYFAHFAIRENADVVLVSEG